MHHRGTRTGGLEADATFLSGNGPLVKFLQDALQSRVFVRNLHRFIGEYGLKERDPRHHVVVFDEAQRMWDRRHMSDKRGIEASEPDLLIRAGERLDHGAALVGLTGEGQEIYVGEEGGLGLWRAALEGSLELAGQQTRRVHGDGFPMWLRGRASRWFEEGAASRWMRRKAGRGSMPGRHVTERQRREAPPGRREPGHLLARPLTNPRPRHRETVRPRALRG